MSSGTQEGRKACRCREANAASILDVRSLLLYASVDRFLDLMDGRLALRRTGDRLDETL